MAFKPIFMKNSKLVLGDYATGTAYECQLRSITLTPEANVARTKTLCPEGQYAEVEDPEWTLELGYLGGNVTGGAAEALADYLLENHGEKIAFHFEPLKGSGSGYSGTVSIIAGGIGGEQGNFSEQSVSLPLDGQPVKYDAEDGPTEGMAGAGTESMMFGGGGDVSDEFPEL